MDPKANRFLSLDVFRGMTICFMIIVNNGSDVSFSPLEHAKWFGFTPTDLVFPSFLFAVGNAMSFSMKKFAGMDSGLVIWRIFKRAALIFLLGYLMYWVGSIEHHADGSWSILPLGKTRIMGVLQRIGLCYLFAALMVHFIKSKKAIIVISILLLLGYWVILLFHGDPADPYGMLTNAGTYLDKWVLGDAHMYHGEKVAFDPEGILSTLPAIVNVIGGYYAGQFIQQKGKGYETISKLMLWGALFIFIALFWSMTFPLAKKLWTDSFVMLTVGIDLIMISALIYIIEIKGNNKGNWQSFFTIFGKNPLPIYIFSELFIGFVAWIYINHITFNDWINNNVFQRIAPGAVGALIFAICYMLVCWLFGKILDKNKIYLKV
jgi:predicted acyltransferase